MLDIKKYFDRDTKVKLRSWFEGSDECLHRKCSECHGTSIKKDGSRCIHMISCRCKKCSPNTY